MKTKPLILSIFLLACLFGPSIAKAETLNLIPDPIQPLIKLSAPNVNFSTTTVSTSVNTTIYQAGILIPLYITPDSNGQSKWQQVIDDHVLHPTVPIMVIVNPSNGVGSSQDSDFVKWIGNLRASGIIVLGYVLTQWTNVAESTIKTQIDKWHSFYTIDGFMFDEMANDPDSAHATYYSDLTAYAKSTYGYSFVQGNAGTSTIPQYIGTVNQIQIYENLGQPILSELSSRTFYPNYDKSSFAYVSKGVSTLDTSLLLDSAKYVDFVYVTNDQFTNAWDTIPPYLLDEFSILDISQTQTEPPPIEPLPADNNTQTNDTNSTIPTGDKPADIGVIDSGIGLIGGPLSTDLQNAADSTCSQTATISFTILGIFPVALLFLLYRSFNGFNLGTMVILTSIAGGVIVGILVISNLLTTIGC